MSYRVIYSTVKVTRTFTEVTRTLPENGKFKIVSSSYQKLSQDRKKGDWEGIESSFNT